MRLLTALSISTVLTFGKFLKYNYKSHKMNLMSRSVIPITERVTEANT